MRGEMNLFFKTLVERCPLLEYEGIEEFLDFKPL